MNTQDIFNLCLAKKTGGGGGGAEPQITYCRDGDISSSGVQESYDVCPNKTCLIVWHALGAQIQPAFQGITFPSGCSVILNKLVANGTCIVAIAEIKSNPQIRLMKNPSNFYPTHIWVFTIENIEVSSLVWSKLFTTGSNAEIDTTISTDKPSLLIFANAGNSSGLAYNAINQKQISNMSYAKFSLVIANEKVQYWSSIDIEYGKNVCEGFSHTCNISGLPAELVVLQ